MEAESRDSAACSFKRRGRTPTEQQDERKLVGDEHKREFLSSSQCTSSLKFPFLTPTHHDRLKGIRVSICGNARNKIGLRGFENAIFRVGSANCKPNAQKTYTRQREWQNPLNQTGTQCKKRESEAFEGRLAENRFTLGHNVSRTAANRRRDDGNITSKREKATSPPAR